MSNIFLFMSDQNRQPYMAISGASIKLMIKSHDHAGTHEQVVFIRLKRAIYDTFVQLKRVW